ncbi:hypothetical protein EK904_008466 [Melospiza melodia maxima]|nr:hypothetical protein EK904_008466 [Melospiza melodia maxima]
MVPARVLFIGDCSSCLEPSLSTALGRLSFSKAPGGFLRYWHNSAMALEKGKELQVGNAALQEELAKGAEHSCVGLGSLTFPRKSHSNVLPLKGVSLSHLDLTTLPERGGFIPGNVTGISCNADVCLSSLTVKHNIQITLGKQMEKHQALKTSPSWLL